MLYSILSDINDISLQKWEAYVQNHPHGDFMHSSSFYHLLKEQDELTPIPIIVVDDTENIVGVALGEISTDKIYIFSAKRTTFYAEPITDADPEILTVILENICKNTQGLFTEIRCKHELTEEVATKYLSYNLKPKDHLSASIQLTNKKDVWENISQDKRKGIQKAKGFGITLEEVSDISGIKLFYPILKQLYQQKRHPLRSLTYFEQLIKQPKTHLLLAYYNNVVIAGRLYYSYKNRLSLFYSATEKKHKHLYAMDLLTWHLIEQALSNKLSTFDFGGAGNPNQVYGPRKYKERFKPSFTNTKRYQFSKNRLFFLIQKLYLLRLKT